MRLVLILVTLFTFTVFSFATDATLIDDVPLPGNVEVNDTGTSPFIGVWTGRWDSWRNHILVVESQDDDGLFNVLYSVGRDQFGSGNWFRTKARADSDSLVFLDNRFAARYSISDTGRLRGVYPTEDRFAILERQSLSAVLATPTDKWFKLGHREVLATNLRENGENVGLAVALYIPEGKGPFPLALVHHGSTGSGTDSRAFKWFFTNDWFADVLNAHGWIVAFPQRRGRGGSVGLCDEGFAEDRSQGYSAEAHLSLPGAERALQDANSALLVLQQRPDVSDHPVLFSGVSRGGVVALMQAGVHRENAAGVINFVGGWMTESPGDPEINPTLFRKIGPFDGEVLSIYGEDDPLYSIEHSRSNLAELEKMGVESKFHVVDVPGHNKGHWVMYWPPLWEEVVSDYIKKIQNRH